MAASEIKAEKEEATKQQQDDEGQHDMALKLKILYKRIRLDLGKTEAWLKADLRTSRTTVTKGN